MNTTPFCKSQIKILTGQRITIKATRTGICGMIIYNFNQGDTQLDFCRLELDDKGSNIGEKNNNHLKY